MRKGIRKRWLKIRIENGCYVDGVGSLGPKLLALGYKNYSGYLQSEHWKELRKRIFSERGSKCEVCNSEDSLNIHHRTYANFGNELESDLIITCGKCHKRIHSSERMGGKGGLEGALNRLKRRVAKKIKKQKKLILKHGIII